MSVKFYILKIEKLYRETNDTVSITFHVPDNLKELFTYKPGQYLTIKLPVNGVENRRAYSISSSPHDDKHISISVKKVDDGKVSTYINDTLKEGDFLEVMPPLGNFTIDANPANQNNYVLIGGGSGITPLFSIIKSLLSIEKKSKVYLIFQNRNQESIIFKNQLNELESKYPHNFFLVNILSQPTGTWDGLKGRLDATTIAKHLLKHLTNTNLNSEYYLCGPQGLMYEAEKALHQLKVESYKIHKENFSSPVASTIGERLDISLTNEEEIKQQKVKIILYSEEFEFVVQPDETIISAAQREGYDPPYSCQIGACSTCRAKLKSGKVFMDERDSLTDEEIAEGYILTCQSHPLTNDVIIDYDDN